MVSVRDVLDVSALALAPVHLADARTEIRWVATSELVDPTPYLEGGELLLTTGLDTVGWRSEWTAYVARLVQARVAALGLGVGLTHRRPPASLVGACRDAGLTLLQVPRPTSFVAVSRATATLLERDEQAGVRDALQTQRLLTQAALREDDTEALLTRLAEVLDGDTVLLAPDGTVLAGGGAGRPGLETEVLARELRRLRPRGLRAAASVSRSAGTTVVQPLGLRGRPSSYLAAHAPGRLTEAQRSAVGTAVALLSLAAERANDRLATARQLRGRALELLVAGEARAAGLILGALVGHEAGPARLPRSVRFARAAGSEETREDALRLVERGRGVAAVHGDELWVLDAATSVARLTGPLVELGLRVGVGAATTLGEAGRAFSTAGHALGQTTEQVRLGEWDRVMAEGALSFIARQQAHDFAASFLSGLAGPNEHVLVETLGSFLRHLGSRQEVAEELGVHRNTVRNRIAEIERAVGGSLDDAQVRADAWIALQARELTSAGAPPG
jgi:purine catabolism regulator